MPVSRWGCFLAWVCLGVVWGVPLGLAGPPGPAEQARYAELDAKPLKDFTNVELAEYLSLRQAVARPADAAEEVGRCALKAVGTPFRLNALRFDHGEADCVTFVERMLAMGLAKDWDSYYRILNRLRTRDGSEDFLERNFFTLADWVPNNAWLLEDITDKLGVPTETFTDVVRRKAFYARLRFGQDDTEKGRAKAAALAAKVAAAPEVERHEVTYIARERVVDVLPSLRTGDVVLIIERWEAPRLKPWLDCNHMGLIVQRDDGLTGFLQAAPREVREERLTRFLDRCESVTGLKFLRLRAQAPELAISALAAVETSSSAAQPSWLDEFVVQMRAARRGTHEPNHR